MMTSCPHCSAKLRVADEFDRKTARCPKCHQPFVIRAIKEEEPGPASAQTGADSVPMAEERPASPALSRGGATPSSAHHVLSSKKPMIIVGIVAVLLFVIGSVLYLTLAESKGMRLARKFMEAKGYRQAVVVLEFERQRDPGNDTTLFLLGECYLHESDFRRANDCLKQSIMITPRNRYAAVRLYVDVLSQAGGQDERTATQYARMAIELDPTAREDVASLLMAKARDRQKAQDFSGAAALAGAASEMLPTSRTEAGQIVMDSALSLAAKDWKNGEVPRLVSGAVELDPRVRPDMLKRLLGLSEAACAEGGEAQRSWFRMLANLDPTGRAEIGAYLMKAAKKEASQGRSAEAVSTASLAGEMDPTLKEEGAGIYVSLMSGALDGGRYDEAENYARAALGMAPSLKDTVGKALEAKGLSLVGGKEKDMGFRLLAAAGRFGYELGDNAKKQLTEYRKQAPQFDLPKEGLILYLPFSGNALDASLKRHATQVQGASLTQDRFGTPAAAYLFNGESDSILIEDPNDDLTFDVNTENFTLSYWAMLSSLPAWDAIAIFDGGTLENKAQSYTLLYRGETRKFMIGAWEGWVNFEVVSETTPVAQKWYHLVMVCENQRLRLYVNGKPENGETTIAPGHRSTKNPAKKRLVGKGAGGRGGRAWSPFPGALDDIRFYSRALSSGEIENLHREGGWAGD